MRYVAVLDWIRSRQSDSVNLGEFPLTDSPTDAQIESAVEVAIEASEQLALERVATYEDVVDAFSACAPDMAIDFCHIGFANVTGTLVVHASKTIDRSKNECMGAGVNLGTGKLEGCSVRPCSIQ